MLGFHKGDVLEFNYKRVCGAWLMAIAIVLIIAALAGGRQIIHMGIFSVGYVVCFYITIFLF